MTSKSYRLKRSQKGQVLTGGLSFLSLFTTISIAICLLVANTGYILYHKQKLNFLAHYAAAAYRDALIWKNGWRQGITDAQAQEFARRLTKRLAKEEGFGGQSLTLSRDGIKVTAKLSVGPLSIIGGGGVIPELFQQTETASVPLDNDQPYCIAKFRSSDGKIVAIPSYGFDLGTISNGNGNFRQLGLESMALNSFPLPNSGVAINIPDSSAMPNAYDRRISMPR